MAIPLVLLEQKNRIATAKGETSEVKHEMSVIAAVQSDTAGCSNRVSSYQTPFPRILAVSLKSYLNVRTYKLTTKGFQPKRGV